MTKIHRIINIIAWGVLLAVFVHLCIKWDGMPETTGVHFDSEGRFDVYASKKFIAYPFVIGIVFLLLLQLGDSAAKKARLGVKMNSDGERKLREGIRLLLDANKLFISGIAAYWAELVIYQQNMKQRSVSAAMTVLFVMFLTLCISVPVLKRIHPQEVSGK